jgi:hypothetical protein
MTRSASNAAVTEIEVEVERPADRARLLNVVRSGDNTTQSVTGSGAAETTLVTNNSAGDWYLERMSFGTPGASPGTLVAIVRVNDASGNLVYGMTGCCNQNNLDFEGAPIKPGWEVSYEILQGDSSNYTVNLWPMIRKPSPEQTSGDNTVSEPDIIDGFEDASLSEYGGDTGEFGTTTTTVYDGNTALSHTGTASNRHVITSSSGLANYPEAGDTFEFAVRIDDPGEDAGFIFGHNGSAGVSESMYEINYDHGSGQADCTIQAWNSAGTNDVLGFANGFSASGEWFRFRVSWPEQPTVDPIQVDVFDANGNNVATATGTDDHTASGFTSGGVGWSAFKDSGGAVYHDLAKIVTE